MPKLPVVTGAEMIRALQRDGFVRMRQSGSHVTLHSHRRDRTVPVPSHAGRTLSLGLTRKIIKQAGLTVEEFRQLLR